MIFPHNATSIPWVEAGRRLHKALREEERPCRSDFRHLPAPRGSSRSSRGGPSAPGRVPGAPAPHTRQVLAGPGVLVSDQASMVCRIPMPFRPGGPGEDRVLPLAPPSRRLPPSSSLLGPCERPQFISSPPRILI